MALVLAVLGGGMAVSRGLDSERSMRVTTDQGEAEPGPGSSTTTATSAPETTTSSSPYGTAATTSTTRSKGEPASSTTSPRPIVTITTVPADSTTTTTSDAPPECRNSTDARCGPFRWDPEPTRSELKVQVVLLTADPTVGKPVNFKVVADDADTRIDSACYDYTDGKVGQSCTDQRAACPEQGTAHGPWTAPEKRPDHVELTPTFTYDKPGTYTVRYTFRTADPECHPRGWTDPYADSSSGEVTFAVRPLAEGEGSTTSSSATTSSSTTSTTRSGTR